MNAKIFSKVKIRLSKAAPRTKTEFEIVKFKTQFRKEFVWDIGAFH
jgi:hypothetical protein